MATDCGLALPDAAARRGRAAADGRPALLRLLTLVRGGLDDEAVESRSGLDSRIEMPESE